MLESRQVQYRLFTGVKGCFVSARDHHANKKHKREDLSAKLDSLELKHSTALLILEFSDAEYEMEMQSTTQRGYTTSNRNEKRKTATRRTQKLEMALVATNDSLETKISLYNMACMHRNSNDPSMILSVMK